MRLIDVGDDNGAVGRLGAAVGDASRRQRSALVAIQAIPADTEAKLLDRRHRRRAQQPCRGAIPARRRAGRGGDGRCPIDHLPPHRAKIAGDRNPLDRMLTEHRRDVRFAVVLDGEQIAVRQQERQACRVATHPQVGHENRRLNAALDQRRSDPFIEPTEAGTPRQASKVKATTSRSRGGFASRMCGSIGASLAVAARASVNGRIAAAPNRLRRDRQRRHIVQRSPKTGSAALRYVI